MAEVRHVCANELKAINSAQSGERLNFKRAEPRSSEPESSQLDFPCGPCPSIQIQSEYSQKNKLETHKASYLGTSKDQGPMELANMKDQYLKHHGHKPLGLSLEKLLFDVRV